MVGQLPFGIDFGFCFGQVSPELRLFQQLIHKPPRPYSRHFGIAGIMYANDFP